jgi:hypothetical protein
MDLTDVERAEFISLTKDSFDSELWTEDDFPYLRKTKREQEEQQVRERDGVPPCEQPTIPEDRPQPPAPGHPEWARVSVPLRSDLAGEPPALCPQTLPGTLFGESEKQRHAAGMSDEELALHVESELRPLGESLRHNIAYIREARERFAHPGRRVPVPGQPTFTQWIRQNLGISERHVRRLLAPPKEATDRSPPKKLAPPKENEMN